MKPPLTLTNAPFTTKLHREMIRIELASVIFAVLLAVVAPNVGAAWFARMESSFSRVARKQLLSVFVVGSSALLLRAALLPWRPIPEPIVHDEFGYLLAADTFAHGRLTNPTHPMWVHFETFSVLQKPTYQCFAQPAQGLILAFGKVVFGHVFWGVWLSIGLMAAAITWMLQGWLAPEWALLGGFLGMLRYAVLSNWGDSYWGGALGALGGALVLGAIPRLSSQPRRRDSLLMALGVAVLANNRPYEGFVLCLPVGVILLRSLLGRSREFFEVSTKRVVLPLGLALALASFATCYYFWRVTGSPFRLPYQIQAAHYQVAPYLIWQHPRPAPIFNHVIMQRMYVGEELAGYHFFRSWLGLLMKVYLFWTFYLGPLLTTPFLLLPYSLPRQFHLRSVRASTLRLIALSILFTAAVGLQSFYNARYSAPATALVLAMVVVAVQNLRQSSPTGLFLSRAIPLICVFMFCLRVGADAVHIPLQEYYEFAWHQKPPPSFGRAAIQKQLENMAGQHLVIVHYAPTHEPFAEWVYNDADIDASKVVWAREMDPAENQRLIEYFKERHVWLLNADATPPELQPWPSR